MGIQEFYMRMLVEPLPDMGLPLELTRAQIKDSRGKFYQINLEKQIAIIDANLAAARKPREE